MHGGAVPEKAIFQTQPPTAIKDASGKLSIRLLENLHSNVPQVLTAEGAIKRLPIARETTAARRATVVAARRLGLRYNVLAPQIAILAGPLHLPDFTLDVSLLPGVRTTFARRGCERERSNTAHLAQLARSATT